MRTIRTVYLGVSVSALASSGTISDTAADVFTDALADSSFPIHQRAALPDAGTDGRHRSLNTTALLAPGEGGYWPDRGSAPSSGSRPTPSCRAITATTVFSRKAWLPPSQSTFTKPASCPYLRAQTQPRLWRVRRSVHAKSTGSWSKPSACRFSNSTSLNLPRHSYTSGVGKQARAAARFRTRLPNGPCPAGHGQ